VIFALSRVGCLSLLTAPSFFTFSPMATPSEDTFSIETSVIKLEEEEGISLSRKRTRESFDESLDDPLWDSLDEGRPKTRRVNPARLAVRLGADLVAEMEAFIVPGAKMPNFDIRKDLQVRYSVDRRHIYDYFHSRGDADSISLHQSIQRYIRPTCC